MLLILQLCVDSIALCKGLYVDYMCCAQVSRVALIYTNVILRLIILDFNLFFFSST